MGDTFVYHDDKLLFHASLHGLSLADIEVFRGLVGTIKGRIMSGKRG